MPRRGNASNPISHQKWQLNSSLQLNKLKRSLFEKLPDTKAAFNKNESAAANMANLGLVYKLDDKDRSLVNYKYEQKKNAIMDVAPPKPFTLTVPESLGKRTEPMMMREWDYDYCGPLVTVYGTNYKAMSRDLKRNYKQKSEAQLRKLCEKYVEFKSFGEAKLNELETLAKEQDAIEKQGTILGAPSAIVEGGAKNNTTNNENQTKRKRADEAADSKTEDNKEQQPKENTKKDSKPTPAKKVNKEETQAPAKKAKKDEAEETPAKKAKKVDTPAKKAETPAKKVTKEEQPKTPTTQTKKQLATKQTETKPATKTQTTEAKTKKVEPKKVEAKKPVDNKKGKKQQEEEDSDMDGMEFDFNEGDLSSDEE